MLKYLARKGWGLLKPKGKTKPKSQPSRPKTKTAKEKHDEFMQKDPYERGAIISKRKSAKKGDVFKGTSVMDTPSKGRSAASIKKFWGPRSYQLTDPARKVKKPSGKK